MSLCTTVSILAREIELQLIDLSSNYHAMLQVMKNMPDFLQQENLADWESAYRDSIHPNEDESSENYKAIDLLYDLAGFNLFAKYQKYETQKLYRIVASQLSESGIKVSKNLDVDKW